MIVTRPISTMQKTDWINYSSFLVLCEYVYLCLVWSGLVWSGLVWIFANGSDDQGRSTAIFLVMYSYVFGHFRHGEEHPTNQLLAVSLLQKCAKHCIMQDPPQEYDNITIIAKLGKELCTIHQSTYRIRIMTNLCSDCLEGDRCMHARQRLMERINPCQSF